MIIIGIQIIVMITYLITVIPYQIYGKNSFLKYFLFHIRDFFLFYVHWCGFVRFPATGVINNYELPFESQTVVSCPVSAINCSGPLREQSVLLISEPITSHVLIHFQIYTFIGFFLDPY